MVTLVTNSTLANNQNVLLRQALIENGYVECIVELPRSFARKYRH